VTKPVFPALFYIGFTADEDGDVQPIELSVFSSDNKRAACKFITDHDDLHLIMGIEAKGTGSIIFDASTEIADEWLREYSHSIEPNLSISKDVETGNFPKFVAENASVQLMERILGEINEEDERWG
jgi:hypothetical protein